METGDERCRTPTPSDTPAKLAAIAGAWKVDAVGREEPRHVAQRDGNRFVRPGCWYVVRNGEHCRATAGLGAHAQCGGHASHQLQFDRPGCGAMTASQFRAALGRLSLTQDGAAEVLGLSMRSVHGYANGAPVPEPVARLLRLMIQREIETGEVHHGRHRSLRCTTPS